MVMRHQSCVWTAVFLCCGAVASAAGCGYRPFAGPAGTLTYQRQNATLHDPYSDNELGPEVVGGRPREFQKPLPEPVRSRWLQDAWWAQ